MAVDYLKTYLGIDPNDYSSMEARIRGEEPQARTPVMMRQPMMMPQQKSLGDIEAMQMMPRQQPAPQPAPQVDDNQNQYPKHQQKTFKQALIIWLAYQK
jgi:hypothetical protein